MKTPYIKFFTRDWQSCPELRMVSYAARGLWIELMCMMTQGSRYGYLEINGQPATIDQIRRVTGGESKEVEDLMTELKRAGVFSCDENGIIFSRRMVSDYKKLVLCTEAGRRAWEANPSAHPMPEDGWSLIEVIEIAKDPTVGMTAESASRCYNNYAATGWMDKNGNPVARSLNALRALLNKWKVNEPSMMANRRGIDPNKPETIEEKRQRLMRSL